jgi:hypothetical protein
MEVLEDRTLLQGVALTYGTPQDYLSLDPNPLIGQQLNPQAVAVGDFNGDGVNDLAVANLTSASVSIFLGHTDFRGNADGTFEYEETITDPTLTNPQGIVAGPFTGSGNVDLAVANNAVNGTVVILAGDGHGNFTFNQVIPTGGQGSYALAVGDFINDGSKDDIAVANSGDASGNNSSVSVLINQGSGVFTVNPQGFPLAAGTGPRSIVVNDFNGDTNEDIAVADFNGGTINVLLGNGDGTFAPALPTQSGGSTSSKPIALATGEFDGDSNNLPDLVTANSGNGTVTTFQAQPGINGTVTFSTVSYQVAGASSSLLSGVVMDVLQQTQGNTLADIAFVDAKNNSLGFLLNDNAGNLTVQQTTYVTSSSPVFLADFPLHAGSSTDALNLVTTNGVISGNTATNVPSNAVTVFLGNGNGTFQAAPTYKTGTPPLTGLAPSDAVVAHLLDSGRPNSGYGDLVATDSGTNDLSISLGTGPDTFGPPSNLSVGPGANPSAVATGVLTASGHTDIVVANQANSSLSVFLGNGDGTFKSPIKLTGAIFALVNPTSLVLGDLNNDGNEDIAVANTGNNTVSVLLGNGNGTFSLAGAVGTHTTPVSVVAGFFRNSNTLDLATANKGSNDVSVLTNDGTGHFTLYQNFSIGPGATPTAIGVGSFNSNTDKVPDLVTVNASIFSGSLSSVSVLINANDGKGDFRSAITMVTGGSTPTNGPPMGVTVGDVNGLGNQGDGIDDIITANPGTNNVSVLEGNGDGTFKQPLNYVVGRSPITVVANFDTPAGIARQPLDLTGAGGLNNVPPPDGANDLVAVNNVDNNVSVLLSQPETPALRFVVPPTPTSTTAGVAFDVAVQAVFQSTGGTGTVDTKYLGTVHFQTSDSSSKAVVPVDYTFTTADAGLHVFLNGATLVTVGPTKHQSITATQNGNNQITGSISITVNPGPATSVAITPLGLGSPPTVTAGSPFQVQVTALDQFDNVATSFQDTVSFGSTDPLAANPLLPNYSFQASDAGVHTFAGVVLFTAGTQLLSVADVTNTTITSGNTTVTVVGAGGTKLLLSAPSTATAGAAFSITVTVLDQFGNAATGYSGTVQFGSSDTQATLPGAFTFSTSDNGVHTFFNGVTLGTAGVQTLTAADTINPGLNGGAAVKVIAGPLDHFNLAAPPFATAGVPFSLTVTAVDHFGNLVAGFNGTIHFTTSAALANLPGDYTFNAVDSGAHTFVNAVILDTSGSQTVTATDTAAATVSGQAVVQVGAAAANHFGISIQPTVTASLAFNATVSALDPFNNVVTGYFGTVHLASSDPAAQLPGNYGFVSRDQGTHVFSVILNSPGVQTLSVTDTSSASLTGTGTTKVQVLLMATGADAGGGPEVRVFNGVNGKVVFDFFAYDPNFRGGVRVAIGDINGDGVPDIITAPGPSGGPDIRVFDGRTGVLIREFMAYTPTFLGGVFVAAGDINGDGFSDIITGADAGGGPHVQVFSGKDGSLLMSFFAYNPGFTGGVRVAAGDVNGDGKADIITAAGAGGGPHVEVFSGADGSILRSFFAYDPGFTAGLYVAAGDANGDGKADILVGPGAIAGGPNVMLTLFNGADLSVLQSFFAYGPGFGGGVRVAMADLNGDGKADLITGAGPGGGPHFQAFDGMGLTQLDSFFAYDPNFTGGLFVGGGQ